MERRSVDVRRDSYNLANEKHPSALSDVKLYDVKQAKAALINSRQQITENEIIEDSDLADYLTNLGASLFARASSRALIRNVASLLSISDRSTIKPSSKVALHHVHCSSRNITEIFVPSHVVPKRTAEDRRRRERPSNIAQNRLLIEKLKNAEEMRKNTRVNLRQRALSRLPVLDSLTIRVDRENKALEKSFLARAQLEHSMFETKSKIRIIVIGAGIAGLSAADQLLSFGFSNVIVLEAQDRVGGRIHSIPFNDPPFEQLEIGVPYVDHADDRNSVYDLVKQCSLLEVPLTGYRSASYDVCQTSTQTQMKMGSISHNFLPRMLMPLDSKLIISHIKSHYCDNVNLGYGDYIRERYRRLTNNDNNVTSSRLVNICQIVNGLPFDGKSQLTDNKNDLAIHFAGFFQKDGGDKIALKKGMSSLLDPLKAKLNSNSLRLNTRVNKIEWNNSRSKIGRNTKVTCSDGRKLYGDHVIVAVPLGFLKENAHTLFQPPISDVKLDAINRVGFGTISKVYLCYEDSFWSRQFTFVWPGKETGYTAGKLWLQTLKFTTMEHQNNVLEVEILGTDFEILLDSQIEEQLTAILCLHFDLDLPKPVRVIKSEWFSNPLFRGTHPYLSIQCSEQDPALLEEPVRRGEIPIVLFAGDYTHKNYVCLIHSARASGIREAHRINNIYDKFFGSENTNF